MDVQVTDSQDSFANGLYAFFTRGVFCNKCRLNIKIKNILILMLNKSSQVTCFMGESQFELFMQAKIWIYYQINLSLEKQELSARLAGFIYYLNKRF